MLSFICISKHGFYYNERASHNEKMCLLIQAFDFEVLQWPQSYPNVHSCIHI